MKKKMFLIAAAAAVLGSCVQDKVLVDNTTLPIAFTKAQFGNSLIKPTATSSYTSANGPLYVAAFYSNGNEYVAAAKITESNGEWKWDTDRLWPFGAELTFPACNDDRATFSKNGIEFVDYLINDGTEDLLYTLNSPTATYTGTTISPIQLTLNHALAKITVMAKLKAGATGEEYLFNNVRLYAPNKGNFFSGEWYGQDGYATEFSVVSNVQKTLNDHTPVFLGSVNGIPDQPTEVEGFRSFWIEVFGYNGTTRVWTGDLNVTISNPLESGKNYIYTLIIDPQVSTDFITFADPLVTDWDDILTRDIRAKTLINFMANGNFKGTTDYSKTAIVDVLGTGWYAEPADKGDPATDPWGENHWVFKDGADLPLSCFTTGTNTPLLTYYKDNLPDGVYTLSVTGKSGREFYLTASGYNGTETISTELANTPNWKLDESTTYSVDLTITEGEITVGLKFGSSNWGKIADIKEIKLVEKP